MPLIARITTPGIFPTGEQFAFTHWIARSSLGDVLLGDAEAWANAMAASLGVAAGWRGLYDANTTFQAPEYATVDMASGVTQAVGFSTSTQYLGSALDGPLPPNLSACVTLRTARAGASYRGRFYLPAFSVGNLSTTGRIKGSSITPTLTALATAFDAAATAAPGVELVVYSRTHHTVEPVVKLDMGDVWDVQRRRRDKLVEVRQTHNV